MICSIIDRRNLCYRWTRINAIIKALGMTMQSPIATIPRDPLFTISERTSRCRTRLRGPMLYRVASPKKHADAEP
jgi:hypothetical protein